MYSSYCKATAAFAALTCALLACACTDTDIVPLPWDNLISIEGEFTTEDSDELQLPVKVLFVVDVTSSMGWVDENGFASGNDPYDLRATAVEQVISEFCGQENYSFGIIRFAEDSDETSDIGPDQPEDVTGGFMKCEDPGDLVNKFSNPITKIKVADGWTPYMTTLALTRRVIKDDIDTLSEETAAITRYVVIFFSDGEPCHLTEREPGKWEMTGEDFDEIFHQIDRLMSLEEYVGDIIMHTSYLDNDSVDNCNNQWTDEIASPQDLLQAMASRGGGTFRNFEDAEAIDFLDFVKGSVYRTYELAHVIATNLNARLNVVNGNLVLTPDSDADGLDDWEEENTYGTNPIVSDTDGDGCRDGLEVRKGFWPLSGIQPRPLDALDPCADNQWDGSVEDVDRDGLTDREELLVTFTNRMRADTDGDGLPDGLEAIAGSNPHNDDIRVPVNSDGDGTPNWTEVRGHTLPHVDENRYKENGREFYEYLYTKNFIGNAEGGRKRYHYQVENISLVETLPLCKTCRGGENLIQLYLVQYADGFGKAPGVFRSTIIRQIFNAPDGRDPDRYNVTLSSKELALLNSSRSAGEEHVGEGIQDDLRGRPGSVDDLVITGGCACGSKSGGRGLLSLLAGFLLIGLSRKRAAPDTKSSPKKLSKRKEIRAFIFKDGMYISMQCFDRESLVIGRDHDVDLRIQDKSVSRSHAALRITERGSLQLTDLKSHNGIWVNGRKVERAFIDRRDKVTIGTYTLKFKLAERRQSEASGKPPPIRKSPTIRSLHPPKVVVDKPENLIPDVPEFSCDHDKAYIERLFPADFALPQVLPGCQVEPDEPANPLCDFKEPFSLLDNLILAGCDQKIETDPGIVAEVIVYDRDKQLVRVEHLRPGQCMGEAVQFSQPDKCRISYTTRYKGQATIGGRIFSLENLKSRAIRNGQFYSVLLSPGDSAHLMHEDGGLFVRTISPQRLPESPLDRRPSPREWLRSPAVLSRAAFVCSAAITHLLVFLLVSIMSTGVSSAALLEVAEAPRPQEIEKAGPVEQAAFGLDLTADEKDKPAVKAKRRKARKPVEVKPRARARAGARARVLKKPDNRLNRQAIAKVVRKHMPEVQNCYEMGLLQDPRLTGQVVLEWTISSSGEVRSITIMRNSMRSPTVAACIAAELRNWSFPKPEQGNVVVSYPFVFSPTSF